MLLLSNGKNKAQPMLKRDCIVCGVSKHKIPKLISLRTFFSGYVYLLLTKLIDKFVTSIFKFYSSILVTERTVAYV